MSRWLKRLVHEDRGSVATSELTLYQIICPLPKKPLAVHRLAHFQKILEPSLLANPIWSSRVVIEHPQITDFSCTLIDLFWGGNCDSHG